MTQAKKPHVHAELIKAWADGAEIEFWNGSVWRGCLCPSWYNDYKYRIKPEPIKTERYRRWISKTYKIGADSGYAYYVDTAVDGEYGVSHIQNSPQFVRWIDEDWQDGVVVDA